MNRHNNNSFVDAVYGHIYIPKDYCNEIIDTLLFQRLRRIEQTSMRSIFHCARHDRFSHSLGTFHIGSKIFKYLKSNTSTNISLYTRIKSIEYNKSTFTDFWDFIQRSYELACLLHDCGHGPFSHTFEEYYCDNRKINPPIKSDILTECTNIINNQSISRQEKTDLIKIFTDDFQSCKAKEHELVSAWLVLHPDGFRDKVIKLKGDPILVARMIMGCKYLNNKAFSYQILNCFIGLLNGNEIDADRTDYAIRDKWSSGLNTTTINLERLYSTIHINVIDQKKEFVICFKKSALPELESILEIKNYNSFWIFNHHKLLYTEKLLKNAVTKLALLFAGMNEVKEYLQFKADGEDLLADAKENNALFSFFDYHNLVKPNEFKFKIGDREYYEDLFLLCDDDITYLLKKYFCTNKKLNDDLFKQFCDRNEYALEWFSRQHELVPLWKSYAEFISNYLACYTELNDVKKILNHLNEEINKPHEFLYKKIKSFLDSNRIDNELVNKIIKECNKKGKVNLYDLKQKLVSLESRYRNEIEPNIKCVIKETITKLSEEELILKPSSFKVILCQERLNQREIKKGSVFINMNNQVVCYTTLDIPKKNKDITYDFFYVFMPKIYDINQNPFEKKDYDKYYKNEIQKAISNYKKV